MSLRAAASQHIMPRSIYRKPLKLIIIGLEKMAVKIEYPKIGICGLSCALCPKYHTDAKSRCLGCKSANRMAAGCPFITCAIKKKGAEFCWDCREHMTCKRWSKHREFGKKHDTFKCYQKLEHDIAAIQKIGVVDFARVQTIREQLLKEMLKEFNEGRSKSYYCIAVTVLEVDDIRESLLKAQNSSQGLEIKEKSKILHSLLDEIAFKRSYCLKLRRM